MSSIIQEGYININSVPIYYKKVGNGYNIILTLHGGPGASHDYLLPLKKLADYGYTLIFYDQCGCGRSGEMNDLAKCANLDYYVEEVEEVRKSLANSKKVILLGHSWGGLLALGYAIRYQKNLKGLIVSSGLSDVPLTVKEMRKLLDMLPKEIKEIIYDCEKNNDFSSEKCTNAVNEFYKRHLLRLEKYPQEVIESLNYLSKRKIYSLMNGPTEFEINGTIRDINLTEQIKNIDVPTLIIVGEFDEVTPNVAKVINDNIRNSKMVIIPNSSHMNFYENPEYYFKVVLNFLNDIKNY
ncbi:MAG: proline iminopeptidase-family hydrolase [Caldisphaera sp.]|jgi:proline iminopeptidase|nr:MAG: proline iminopeptidase [Caldisphaera sp.]